MEVFFTLKKYKRAFETLERPFAWLDLDALDANITTLSLQTKEKRVRIATKSVRSVEVLRYLEEHVPYMCGYMTYSAAETDYLAQQGLNHFLIGYPVYETESVRNLCKWIKKGKDITFMIDALAQAGWLHQIAKEQEVKVNVCIDLNLSIKTPIVYFGTRRSSITTVDDASLLIDQLQAMSSLEIVGVMGYEAQLAGVQNQPKNKAKGLMIQQLQQQTKEKVTKLRQQMVALVKQKVGDLQFVNGGGTGSLVFTANSKEVTEVTIGSGFYAPSIFDFHKSVKLESAAGFALRVTRKPTSDTIVCHGGGYIASGISEQREPTILSAGLTYYPTEGAGEVQTPLKVSTKEHYEIGDTVYFRHVKAGELCEHFKALHLVRSEKYKGAFNTYRGDGQCFL